MNAHKRTARIVGVLFLLINVTFILGAFGFVEPAIGSPDYLEQLSERRTQVVIGVLLELINGIGYIGIAVLMVPILRVRFESMALWYLAFRIIEFVAQTLSDLSPLALLNVSEEFLTAGAPESSVFQVVGGLLLAERAWAFQMVTIALVLGALFFYYMLYQSKLVPRFISVWGFIAAIAVLTTALLDIFGVDVGALDFLGVLMLTNELFLGGWLIVKGFNTLKLGSQE
jgi:hypothetical protein